MSNVDIDKQIEQIFNSKKSVKETMVGANEQGESKFLCLNVGQTKNKINQKRNRFLSDIFGNFEDFFEPKKLPRFFLTIFI